MEVVVVFPWLPATAIPYFSRINSASSSPRGITGMPSRRASCTSGFCSSTAELTTSARAPPTFAASCPSKTVAPIAASRSVIGESFRSEPLMRVSEIQQHLGDPAHADPADAREMQVLGTKKHFFIVLFRLARQ